MGNGINTVPLPDPTLMDPLDPTKPKNTVKVDNPPIPTGGQLSPDVTQAAQAAVATPSYTPAPKTATVSDANVAQQMHWTNPRSQGYGMNLGTPETPRQYGSDEIYMDDNETILKNYKVTLAKDYNWKPKEGAFRNNIPYTYWSDEEGYAVQANSPAQFRYMLWYLSKNNGLDHDPNRPPSTKAYTFEQIKEYEFYADQFMQKASDDPKNFEQALAYHNSADKMMYENWRSGSITKDQYQRFVDDKATLEDIYRETNGEMGMKDHVGIKRDTVRVNFDDYLKWAEANDKRTPPALWETDKALQDLSAAKYYANYVTNYYSAKKAAAILKAEQEKDPVMLLKAKQMKIPTLPEDWTAQDKFPDDLRIIENGKVSVLPPHITPSPKILVNKINALAQKAETEINSKLPTGYTARVIIPDLDIPRYEVHLVNSDGAEFDLNGNPVPVHKQTSYTAGKFQAPAVSTGPVKGGVAGKVTVDKDSDVHKFTNGDAEGYRKFISLPENKHWYLTTMPKMAAMNPAMADALLKISNPEWDDTQRKAFIASQKVQQPGVQARKWEDMSVDEIKAIAAKGGPELNALIDQVAPLWAGPQNLLAKTEVGRQVLSGAGQGGATWESILMMAGIGNAENWKKAVNEGNKMSALGVPRSDYDMSLAVAKRALSPVEQGKLNGSIPSSDGEKLKIFLETHDLKLEKLFQPEFHHQMMLIQAESAPASLPIMAAGMVVTIATRGKTSGVMAQIVSSIAGGTTSALFESAQEAAGTYIALREQGIYQGEGKPLKPVSHELAQKASQIVFLKNMGVLMGGNSLEFLLAFAPGGAVGKKVIEKSVQTTVKGAAKGALKTTGKVVGAGLMEGIPEGLQQAFQLDAQGIPFDMWDPSIQEAFLAGVAGGLGVGGGGQIITSIKENVQARLEAQAQQDTDIKILLERFNQVYGDAVEADKKVGGMYAQQQTANEQTAREAEQAQTSQNLGDNVGNMQPSKPRKVTVGANVPEWMDEANEMQHIADDEATTVDKGWNLYRAYKDNQKTWSDEQKQNWNTFLSNSPELKQASVDLEVATDANIGTAWNNFSNAYSKAIDQLRDINYMATQMGAIRGSIDAMDLVMGVEGGPEIIAQASKDANNQYVHKIVQKEKVKATKKQAKQATATTATPATKQAPVETVTPTPATATPVINDAVETEAKTKTPTSEKLPLTKTVKVTPLSKPEIVEAMGILSQPQIRYRNEESMRIGLAEAQKTDINITNSDIEKEIKDAKNTGEFKRGKQIEQMAIRLGMDAGVAVNAETTDLLAFIKENAKGEQVTAPASKVDQKKSKFADSQKKIAEYSKKNMLTSGLDPELMKLQLQAFKDLVELAGAYIEEGVKSAAEFAQQAGIKLNSAAQRAWDEASGKTRIDYNKLDEEDLKIEMEEETPSRKSASADVEPMRNVEPVKATGNPTETLSKVYHGLEGDFEDILKQIDPTHNKMSIAKVVNAVAKYVDGNTADARLVSEGKKHAPDNLPDLAVKAAYARKMLAAGDSDGPSAAKRFLRAATGYAQNLTSLRGWVNPNSQLAWMRKAVNSKLAAVGSQMAGFPEPAQRAKKAVKNEYDKLQKFLTTKALDAQKAQAIIDKLICP